MLRNRTTSTYYNYNAHGDVVQLTNAEGTVTKDYTYNAFGRHTSYNDTNPIRYCGEYYDTETGNIYLRNRYYSPEIGRFINEDPIRSGGNWYSYCSNNPIGFIDPNGLEEILRGTKILAVPVHNQLGYNSCAAANIAMGIAGDINEKLIAEQEKLLNEGKAVEKISLVSSDEIEKQIWKMAEEKNINMNKVSIISKVNMVIGHNDKTYLYDGFNTPVYSKVNSFKPQKELTAKMIMDYIDNGSDIKVLYNVGSGADYLGHFITIIGYEYTDDGKYVHYNDTADGATHIVTVEDIQTYDFDSQKQIVGHIDSIYVKQIATESEIED